MRRVSMESKQGRTISVLGLFVSLTMPFLSPAYGNTGCVRWEDLAEHLSAKSIPLVQLNLCDSPENMQDIEPDRVMSQIIENAYYLWEEHDIALDTDIYMCIVMKKPNPGPLSAQEAQVLLTGSMLWRAPIPNLELYSLNESYVQQRDGAPSRPESVIGVDGRTRITGDRTDDFPWNTYCALESVSDIGDGWISLGYGTGCLVGPYTVLTCAHTIYSHDRASFIDTMTVIPGQTQNYKDGPTMKPYNSQEIVDYEIAPEYINNDRAEYEYGAIFLDKPLSGISTYMPLEFSSYVSDGDTVSIAGYPGEVMLGTSQEDKDSHALWDATSAVTRTDPDTLYYETDTSSGDSGAPIRNRNSSVDPYRIIGIHSRGAGSYNRGARLGTHNQALINKWMQWTPPVEYHSTDVPKAIPDGGAIFSELNTFAFGSIADVKVKLDITHTRVEDLDVYLHHEGWEPISSMMGGRLPVSVTIELFTDVGGSGNSFRNTILDFDAPLSITDGSAPFTGSYRPEGSLTFPHSHGTWTLEIRDDAGGHAGTLNSWSLIVREEFGPPRAISADNYNESFESDFGEWVNIFGSDDIDWTRERSGTRSSNTGPTSAHSGDYYLYVEASGSGRGYPNRTAILESPCLEIPVPPASPLDWWIDERSMYELQFSYHMRGDEMGTLSVEILAEEYLLGWGTVWNGPQVWSRSGAQGSGWQDGSVSLYHYQGEEIKVRFKAVTGAGHASDIAIDDISVNIGWGRKTTVFEDAFPSSSLDVTKWTEIGGPASVSDRGIDEPSLPYSLKLGASVASMHLVGSSLFGSVTSKMIDLSQFSIATLTYHHQKTGGGASPEAFENSSNLTVSYWNGSDWEPLPGRSSLYPNMTDYEPVIVTLPSDALHANFRLRISRPRITPYDGLWGRGKKQVNCGDWFLDNVKIEASDSMNAYSTIPSDPYDSHGRREQMTSSVNISDDWGMSYRQPSGLRNLD